MTLLVPLLAALMLSSNTFWLLVTRLLTISLSWLVTGTRFPAILETSCCSAWITAGSVVLYCLSMTGIKSLVIPWL
ncbi:hypothetical protein Pmgp_01264 [Pelotomaculum propionicicum]|uniref:Uncharacterized protein n=1 Tax=Pelotomaculum propionicicum TaxID=258475 RepID=A0A4Y7RUF8_9FIRM|nr:hypothetical protein Pmgp_01264 [Pelotomaculum propionicicum]